MRSWYKALISCLVLSLILPAAALAQQASAPEISAQAAVLLDFQSGQILYSKDGQKAHVPASLVKIMTMYVALDQVKAGRVSLSDTVVVSESLEHDRLADVPGTKRGRHCRTAAHRNRGRFGQRRLPLGGGIAGAEAAYVQLMNAKAEALGLPMRFVDVHGLSDQNSVTAEAVARLARAYLIDHPEAIRFHQQVSFSYQPRSAKTPIVQYNRNGLLRSYEGADGLKTGQLEAAGYNLVATAVQNNRRLIAVILGSDSETKREQEAAALLNYGYRGYDLVNLAPLLEGKTARVFKGKQSQVGLMVEEPVISVPKGVGATMSVAIQTKDLEAPVQKGTEVGVLSIYLQEQLVKQVPLLAGEDVARGNLFKVLWDNVSWFLRNLIRRR